jgi:uncharacterized protein YggE
MVCPKKMSRGISDRRQTLIAVAVVVMMALLATQTYTLLVSSPSPGPKTATAASQVTGSDSQTNDTITVSGNGLVQVSPDRAILTIGVVTQATTATDAAQQNANEMSAVISALEGIGISNSSIQTTSYSIYPQSNCCNNEPPTITGYQVSNQVQVTVIASGSLAQLGAKAGQAIDTAASKGANEIDGIEFTASNAALQQAQQTALQLAVQNASADAHVLAAALGVTITGVVSATTNPGYTPQPYYGPVFAAAATSSTPIVPPQSLTVSATVQVVYAIS